VFGCDVTEASFDVQKEGEHLEARPLQGLPIVHAGEAGIVCAQSREGTALVGVNEAL